MKVLSIKEPFASLIKENVKQIETRSWKTNYRGELYIHASLTKSNLTEKSADFAKLISNLPTSPGHIICKCQLTDCILMTEEYIEKMKQNHHQEYICGRYEVGRYAWVLENVEPLAKPIPAKGKLNIWNYDLNENMPNPKNN